jgi:3-dehydroquinate dehydratase/shikimate dehydrogenase
MTQPLLCETISAPTMAALRARRDAATHADLIELRLDHVDRPDVAGALAGRTRPVLVTCRAAWEGGGFEGSEEERQQILADALAAGAEFVDLEWKATGTERWLQPADLPRIVLSHHDFDAMPRDAAERVREMRRAGAGVVKLAARASGLRDLATLLAIGRSASEGERTVLIGMGPHGLASRVLAAHFGSCWTYAGEGVAPGQVPAARLLEEFRFRSITADTPVYAVVGRPILHSLSPCMHNAAFGAAGVRGVYVPCEAADWDDFLALADALPLAGASVTAPFKQHAFAHSQIADADASSAEAVNTLRAIPGASALSPEGWEGRNTDVAGFLAPLESRVALKHLRVAVLGAGGAARGIVHALGTHGARVTVHARDPRAAADVAALAGGDAASLTVPGGSWDLLVNTTPIGTFPNVDETPCDGPFDGRLVYDLIYNPRQTRLLRMAAAAGCETIDGLEMLVQQAARQFAWWTGVTPDVDLMRAAAVRRLATVHGQTPPDTSAPASPGSAASSTPRDLAQAQNQAHG